MGYTYYPTKTEVRISKESEENILKGFMEYFVSIFSNPKDYRRDEYKSYYDSLHRDNHIAFVQCLEIADFKIDYSSETHHELDFVAEFEAKQEYLDILYPHVELGSYIEYRGEDGDWIRDYFTSKGIERVKPEMIWPDVQIK